MSGKMRKDDFIVIAKAIVKLPLVHRWHKGFRDSEWEELHCPFCDSSTMIDEDERFGDQESIKKRIAHKSNCVVVLARKQLDDMGIRD